MSKKTLKDKIRQVGFWTFSGVFWYLVISFFLLSDYPIQDQPFNGEDAYMAIKDALGLAAAFLAPVAAFVLFQDWREQHTSISIERNSTEVLMGINRLKNNLLDTQIAIDSDDFDENKVNDSLEQIGNRIEELKEINKQIKTKKFGEAFAEAAFDLLEKIHYLKADIAHLCSQKIKISKPADYNDYLDTTDEEYVAHITNQTYKPLLEQIFQVYPEINNLIANLEMLWGDLQVQQ